MRELLLEIGSYAGLVSLFGLAIVVLVGFTQGRDIRRLREWAGSAPERDADRKEATSAAAAQRAEEMRKLEEARDEERQAADSRETRRERREAGLPELSRGERIRARLREPLVMVAIAAVVVVAVGGVAYAVISGGEEEGGGKHGKHGKEAKAVKPSQIEVAVLNGTAVEGLAGSYGDMVEEAGFELGAVTNSETSFEESVVMFEPHQGRAAQRVAKALEIDAVRPITEEIAQPAAGAPVAVVIGEDNASSAG